MLDLADLHDDPLHNSIIIVMDGVTTRLSVARCMAALTGNTKLRFATASEVKHYLKIEDESNNIE